MNCKSKYIIYLTKWIKCKRSYVGKCKTELNQLIEKYIKDVLKLNTGPGDWHFTQKEL